MQAEGSQKKIVYFVRHAEAIHNVREREAVQRAIAAGETSKERQEEARKAVLREDKSLRDAPLSPDGSAQARSSGKRLQALFGVDRDGMQSKIPFRRPDVVLVSPLRRAVMTATELFYNVQVDGDPPMFVAVEALREKRTGLECDERSSVTELQREFPHVDFADVLAGSLTVPIGEDNNAVRARAAAFLDRHLFRVDCKHVAVVTHKGWLREVRKYLKGRVDAGDLRADFDLSEWDEMLYGNAEVRVAAFRWQDGELTSIVSRSVDNAILASAAMMGDGFEFALGPPSSGFSMFLAERTTKVHFISVSEGEHNVAVRTTLELGGNSNSEAEQSLLRRDGQPASVHPLYDARLTRKGLKQAKGLRDMLANRPSGGRPFTAFDLVVVSPLTRACETAQRVFEDSPGEYGGIVIPPPRILVREECRERYGRYVCDGRRSVAELAEEFPTFDFSEMTVDDDIWHGDERETSAACRERALRLLEWLSSRPQKCVAVVTHGEFLRHLFGQFGDNLHDEDRSCLQRVAENCELRSVVLCSHGSVRNEAKDGPASTVQVAVRSRGSMDSLSSFC